MNRIKLTMSTTAIVTTMAVIGLGIYDLICVVVSGDTSLTISQFLVNVGFNVPAVVFAAGFICGHVFGYLRPVGVVEKKFLEGEE